ncbi:hypothetical protein DLM45_07360 [Hyphomicrobium methylovorum]|uniref:hypothetical protein n=1 Tax=Hyphomicrobium methylovorum TaxID=84 RepID=UPI0015E7CBEF|nr:hypothetical protein [Hyphomicrobium methylovorum]MBA2126040.1 hypothetical protein [Hyphomicrobium methylovorum]
MGDSKSKTPKSDCSGGKDEPVCAGQALGFPLRRTLGFSPIENVTLDVFRCVCDVYSSGSTQPWEIAMKAAEEHLGDVEGPVLVGHVTALLRALRRERALGFSYLSIGCHHISPDELAVTAVLKSVHLKDQAAFERGIALILDNGKRSERTRSAVRALAAHQSRHRLHSPASMRGATDFETQSVQATYLH